MEELLLAAGLEVISFDSGEAFLEAVLYRPACVVVEIHLSGMSGFDLCARIHGRTDPSPVVLITAHDTAWSRLQAERSSAAAYLAKPFTGRRLLESVNRHLKEDQ